MLDTPPEPRFLLQMADGVVLKTPPLQWMPTWAKPIAMAALRGQRRSPMPRGIHRLRGTRPSNAVLHVKLTRVPKKSAVGNPAKSLQPLIELRSLSAHQRGAHTSRLEPPEQVSCQLSDIADRVGQGGRGGDFHAC